MPPHGTNADGCSGRPHDACLVWARLLEYLNRAIERLLAMPEPTGGGWRRASFRACSLQRGFVERAALRVVRKCGGFTLGGVAQRQRPADLLAQFAFELGEPGPPRRGALVEEVD